MSDEPRKFIGMVAPELPDSFADHPKSVSQLKSDKSNSASEATPRDCLIEILRKIDKGEISPDTMVIVYRNLKDDDNFTEFRCASKDTYITTGLLERAKFMVLGILV